LHSFRGDETLKTRVGGIRNKQNKIE
jgi:hypothetical protein